MLIRHWLWWHRHDADRTEVLVIFDVTADFEIVSISDASGVDQDLTRLTRSGSTSRPTTTGG